MEVENDSIGQVAIVLGGIHFPLNHDGGNESRMWNEEMKKETYAMLKDSLAA